MGARGLSVQGSASSGAQAQAQARTAQDCCPRTQAKASGVPEAQACCFSQAAQASGIPEAVHGGGDDAGEQAAEARKAKGTEYWWRWCLNAGAQVAGTTRITGLGTGFAARRWHAGDEATVKVPL